MLIIAIPKSASTSLMLTMAKLHQLPAEQPGYPDLNTPNEFRYLSAYHGDIVDLTPNVAEKISEPNRIYKQHFPPTANNIKLLKRQKTVLLLRRPAQVLDAYYRAIKTFSIEKPVGFERNLGKESWLTYISESGLEREINLFYRGWLEVAHENILTIYFEDLILNPVVTINAVERFWELPVTPGPFSLMKIRYTRSPIYTGKRKLGIWARKLNVYDGIIYLLKKFGFYKWR